MIFWEADLLILSRLGLDEDLQVLITWHDLIGVKLGYRVFVTLFQIDRNHFLVYTNIRISLLAQEVGLFCPL
jgi:hypothetical protein